MPRVTFLPSGKCFDVRHGATILRAAVRARVRLGRACRGDAVCAACKVTVVSELDHVMPPTRAEQRLMERHPLAADERYACQARVVGDVSVTTTYW